ncbi:MAG: hypothetical protein JXR26_05635 [Balneolaceae bacterium]|nr:hypothetical protein [Balneolaceae bacterium]
MKLFKSITVALLLILGLSGCYTQLQYAQKSERVEDQESVEEYSWDGEEQAYPNEGDYEDQTAGYYDGYYDEDYVPVYYKDYETANYWADCLCNPYGYNSGYIDGYGDGFYDGRSYGSPIVSIGLGFGTFGPRFGFQSWYHNPSWYYSSRFWFNYYYGPASPFHYYAWAGYTPFFHNPYFYRSYWYGGYGYHYPYYGGYYGGGYVNVRPNEPARRTGLRSGGASRIETDGRTRSRGASRIDNGTRSRSSGTTVRTRSTSVRNSSGTTRSRGNVERTRTRSRGTGRVTPTRTRNSGGSGSVGRSRTGSGSSRGTRSRGGSIDRGNDRNESMSPVGYINTRREYNRPRSIQDFTPRERQRNTLRNTQEQNRQRSSSNGFWGRIKKVLKSGFDRTTIRSRSNDDGPTRIRSIQRSSPSRPAVRSRSNSGSRSSGTSVKRSRSRSSSSGTRSRSSGGSRSRDRGNN